MLLFKSLLLYCYLLALFGQSLLLGIQLFELLIELRLLAGHDSSLLLQLLGAHRELLLLADKLRLLLIVLHFGVQHREGNDEHKGEQQARHHIRIGKPVCSFFVRASLSLLHLTSKQMGHILLLPYTASSLPRAALSSPTAFISLSLLSSMPRAE